MKIKKYVALVAIVLMMLGLIAPLSTAVVSAAPSYDKASVYVKISIVTSYDSVKEIPGDNLSGNPDKKTFKDNFSILVEGTTELEADAFDFDEDEDGYKELSPVERNIRASCGGSGSISVKGTKVKSHPTNPANIKAKDFPFSSEHTWSYAMDGKELVDENDEAIELIHSLNVYPSEKKGEAPKYELVINQDAISSINMYHILARGQTKHNSSDFEGSHSDSSVIDEGGSYGASLLAATTYYMAVDEDYASEESFTKGQFKLENDKFVSSGHFTNTYKPEEYETTTITIEYTINKDPQIKNIQVNQGLGRYEYIDDENYVPATDFAAGKNTAIQVFFFEETPVEKVKDVELDIYRNGSKITTLKDFKTDKKNNALIFIPNSRSQCGNWKEGHYKFKARYKESEFVLDNVKLTKMSKFRVLAVPVKSNLGGKVGMPGGGWQQGNKLIKKVFPLGEKDLEWWIGVPLDASAAKYDVATGWGLWELSELLKTLQPTDGSACYDAIVGFVPKLQNMAGCTYESLSVIISTSTEDMPGTVAHEISHLSAVGDEYSGGSYNTGVNMPPYGYQGTYWYDDSKPASGTDKNIKAYPGLSGALISEKLHPYEIYERGMLKDSMGFMGGDGPPEKIWINPSVWKHLFDEFSFGANLPTERFEEDDTTSSPLAARIKSRSTESKSISLQPSGYISDSGELHIAYPWKTTYASEETSKQTGDYTIRALDASGDVLASQGFTPSFGVLTNPPKLTDRFALSSISVPFPEGTTAFVFMKGDMLLEEIPVSRNKPEVSVTMPANHGEYSGNVSLEWQGHDPDGDTLYYTAEYSHNGAEWVVLKANMTETMLSVDFGALPGGDNAYIRIIASDGINSAKVETEPFKVPYKSPELFIDDAVISEEGVTFSASAYDSADGWMYDDRITWTSDKDGEIGNGSSLFLTTLSKGKHSITVTAKNGHGQQAVKTFDITVDGSSGDVSGFLSAIFAWPPSFENMTGLIFWAAVILVIILIIVVIIRAATKKKKCPKCGKKCKKKASDCPKCGYHFLGDFFPAEPNQQQQEPKQLDQPQQEQSQQTDNICQSCGRQNTPTAKFCAGCGYRFMGDIPQEQQEQLQQSSNVCQSCGRQNTHTAKFCAGCGSKLN